jgi:hypothetical protein
MNEENLKVTCPSCDTQLIVDPSTGEVLWHEAKEKGGRSKGSSSLSDMIANLDKQRRVAEEKVEKEKQNLKDRGRLLEEKVREAMKRVDPSDTTPPVRPFDLD